MSAETSEEPGQEQSFLSHLVELRQRLVRAAIAVIVIFIPMAFFMQPIFDFLSQPMMAALPLPAIRAIRAVARAVDADSWR